MFILTLIRLIPSFFFIVCGGVEDLKKLNQGTSINGIIRDDLVRYPIKLPPIEQQQRIAEILSTVDEAIEQTEALIAKMQQIKAGLMHDLFTRGVTPETSSAINSWLSTNFGAISKHFVNGGTPPTEVDSYWNGSIPWITGADFTPVGIEEFRRFVSMEAVRNTSTNVIDKGNLLVVTRTGVGKLAIAQCDVAISQDITGVYPDLGQVDTQFLFHRMRCGVEDLKKLNQGTSINGIIRDDLVKYPIELPPIEQQQRIAEILSTVDEAIEQSGDFLAKTQQIKAGLMHDLLTGQIEIIP